MPKIASHARILDAVGGVVQEIDFVMCCHCGAHHAYRSTLDAHLRGEQRLGFCQRCNAPRCLTCAECVPLDAQLANVEAGRHHAAPRPVSIVLPCDVPG